MDTTALRVDPPQCGFDSSDAPQLWKILKDADTSFVPPLSSRSSSTQGSLTGHDVDPRGPQEYFDELRSQHFILARLAEQRNSGQAGIDPGDGIPATPIVGFMSFRPNFALPIDSSAQRYSYVSTIIVEPAYRRRGLTRTMYKSLISESATANQGVATRTWSGNSGHIYLIESLGFQVVNRISDDRGDGIDTLYYALEYDHKDTGKVSG